MSEKDALLVDIYRILFQTGRIQSMNAAMEVSKLIVEHVRKVYEEASDG